MQQWPSQHPARGSHSEAVTYHIQKQLAEKKRKEKEKNIVFASLHCSNVSLCCSNTQVYRVCKYTMTSLLGVVTDSDLMRTSDYTVPCVARCGQRTTDLAVNHSFLSLVLNTRHVFSAAMGPSYQNQTSLLQR